MKVDRIVTRVAPDVERAGFNLPSAIVLAPGRENPTNWFQKWGTIVSFIDQRNVQNMQMMSLMIYPLWAQKPGPQSCSFKTRHDEFEFSYELVTTEIEVVPEAWNGHESYSFSPTVFKVWLRNVLRSTEVCVQKDKGAEKSRG